MSEDKRAVAIREMVEAWAAIGHKQVLVGVPDPPWDAASAALARARMVEVLAHLSGCWMPVEDERALAVWNTAISAACRLWLAVVRPFEPQPVEPVGERETVALVTTSDGCRGLVPHKWSIYPSSPWGERLREARTGILRDAPRVALAFDGGEPVLVEAQREDRRVLSLGEAVRLAGLTAVEVSGLERGSLTLQPEAWEELVSLVDSARLAKGGA